MTADPDISGDIRDPGAEIREFILRRHPDVHLDEHTDIFELGFITSLFGIQLVMFIENSFGIRIPNEQLRLDNLRTVAAMSALVERQLLVEQESTS